MGVCVYGDMILQLLWFKVVQDFKHKHQYCALYTEIDRHQMQIFWFRDDRIPTTPFPSILDTMF